MSLRYQLEFLQERLQPRTMHHNFSLLKPLLQFNNEHVIHYERH